MEQMNELSQEGRGSKTRPWSDDEYIVVDGQKLVYTANKKDGVLLVHMYGGKSETVDGLRAQDHSVKMPARLRTNHYA